MSESKRKGSVLSLRAARAQMSAPEITVRAVKLKEAVRLNKEEGLPQTEAAKRAGTSRTTLFRFLKNGGDASGKKA